MVKWSPSVMGYKHRRSTLTMRQLYPPFLQREHDNAQQSKETSTESVDIDFSIKHSKERFVKISDSELRDTYEPHAEDYQFWSDDFEEDDYRFEEKGTTESLWSLEHCKTYSTLSKHDEEPDTTDPFMSHELYLPYNLTPRARNFTFTDPEHGYQAIILPRRPRSPVRTLLPGKFDLSAAYEEREKLRRIKETTKRLREAKRRISQSMKQLPFDWSDVDLLISSLVLQAVCEEVTMTLTNVRLDTDIHTFVNTAVIWALRDMDIFGYEILVEEEFLLLSYFRTDSFEHELEVSNMLKSSGTRRMLLSAFRAPFSRSNWATFHRRLPWSYVCPSHEKGHTKFYPNIHERINEMLPKGEDAVVTSSYVSDLACYHFGDVSDKSYVAYRRKSKFATEVPTAYQTAHTLFVELANFVP